MKLKQNTIVTHESNGQGIVLDIDTRGFALVKFEKYNTPWYIEPSRLVVTEVDVISEPEKATTGSLRFNIGKPQTNEINPEFILDMGRVLSKSREKYPRANWALGNNYSVPFDSLMRHLLAWHGGEKNDIESGHSHLAHAALNLMMLHYYEERFPELDDRIFKKEKK